MGEPPFLLLLVSLFSLIPTFLAYRPGDIVPMSKMGQYHSVRFPVLVYRTQVFMDACSYLLVSDQLFVSFTDVYFVYFSREQFGTI